MSIRVGILGYGNLGRGVECAVKQNDDMELAAVFTRRDPSGVTILTEGVPVCSVDDAADWKDKIDVLILCGGSATDLPKQTPEFAKLFNVIDSFDTHARIPEHFANVDAAAKESGKVGIISVGWDPGMFSLNRLYANAILPDGKDYTFWGKGGKPGSFRCDQKSRRRKRRKTVHDSVRSSSLRQCETEKTRNLRHVRNIQESVLLSLKRGRGRGKK